MNLADAAATGLAAVGQELPMDWHDRPHRRAGMDAGGS